MSVRAQTVPCSDGCVGACIFVLDCGRKRLTMFPERRTARAMNSSRSECALGLVASDSHYLSVGGFSLPQPLDNSTFPGWRIRTVYSAFGYQGPDVVNPETLGVQKGQSGLADKRPRSSRTVRVRPEPRPGCDSKTRGGCVPQRCHAPEKGSGCIQSAEPRVSIGRGVSDGIR